ncbi:hypothetical protein [Jiangella ureilytica]|uniref:hypothetical protein n=1 Tax=Jiangella ureilytica TaxID=2530374 RepID=UPI0013A5E45C|nr:hypothetical protein [Jiangella ureilytica]
MTRTALPDDATVEAILQRTWIPSGGDGWADLAALADAVAAIRRCADAAVPPRAELARRIAAGDFTGVTPTPPDPDLTARARLRRRLAAMSHRTRAVAVLAAGFTGLTGVAAAGSLPDSAQQRVESVIEAVTPISFDDHAGFGQDVADDAQDGGVDGQEVSEDAHELGEHPGNRPADQGREPVLPELPTQVPTTPAEHRPDDPGRPEDGPGTDVTAPGQEPTNRPVDPGDRPADPDDPPSGAEGRQPADLPQQPPGEQRP